jgi:hypothetical protein
MSKHLLFSLLMCLLVGNARSQNCDLQSKVVSSVPVKETDLIPQLEKHQLDVFYNIGEVDDIRSKVNRCNQQNGIELSKIERERRVKIDKINSLLRYADVAKIREQIKQLENSRAQAGQNLEKSLDGNNPSGLFLVLIKNPSVPDKQKLQTASQAALAPMAVKDLKGSQIERVTSITSLKEVDDLVLSYTNGEMLPVGGALYDRMNYQSRYYLYLARVEVKLLKKSPAAQNINPFPATTVFNLEKDVDFESKLLAEGVIREQIEEIKGIAYGELDKIKQSNEDALSILRTEVQKTENEMKGYNEKIVQKKEDEKASATEIERICKEINLPTSGKTPEQSAEEAQRKLKMDIAKLESSLIVLKDMEIFPLRQPIKGSSDGNVHKDIAKKIVEGAANLETQAGNAFEVDELIEVKNGLVEQNFKSNKVKYKRKISKIWAFPVAGTNDDFQVFLFGQFKSLKNDDDKIDSDGDGIVNSADRCPNQSGLKKFSGCPDKDKDGVPDIDDKCPEVSGKVEYEGCKTLGSLKVVSKKNEVDTDGDGVVDSMDECPYDKGLALTSGCPISLGLNLSYLKGQKNEGPDIGVSLFFNPRENRYTGLGFSVGSIWDDSNDYFYTKINYDYSFGVLLLSADVKFVSRGNGVLWRSVSPKVGFTLGLLYLQLGYEVGGGVRGNGVTLSTGININGATDRSFVNTISKE